MDWTVSAFLLDCKTDNIMNLFYDVRWEDLVHWTSCTVGVTYSICVMNDKINSTYMAGEYYRGTYNYHPVYQTIFGIKVI
jgi:hypothetical protein